MAALNGWNESFNHDLAIRRFCPARVEQEQGEWEWDEKKLPINEFDDLSSPSDATTLPCLPASEVDEFVDSFINMDHCDKDEIETFSVVNDVYGDVPMMMMMEEDELEMSHEMVPGVEEMSRGVDQGLHLVHMLLACAEAVGCRDTQLADSILAQIWASATPFGDSLQRVSYCFAAGLKSRLSLFQNVNANGTFTDGAIGNKSLVTREEELEAFRLLHQTTPYIAFGFMAANEAICEAAQGKESLHIIDLGMEHTLQWPSLIRALGSRPEGPPRLRITGFVSGHNVLGLEGSMKELVEDATSLGITLEPVMISDPVTPSLLTREKLNLREGEALFVNSIMHLHKYVKESRGSLKPILQAIKKLCPTALTVVEQDANHNGPFFLGRLLESLHYYSAIFDSLEVSLPRNSVQRMKIERLHFAEEIRNIVAYEGCDRIERHERVDQWRRQLGRAGFQVMGLKCMSQARMMISVYGCDGYTLASEKGCLLLGWKGRPIMLASAWQVPNVLSS
ncbi:GRAS family protein RAD1-like [Alnus glutinosa]|uniref:GRAS family protein RAD1-like n=1 Tax=Alnus glutinosa TaxID=3517 RepID=UPI002D77F65A|nr:GRAS family protein RAD1-like [Alnus glutinosa]